MFAASDRLTPAAAAPPFPSCQVYTEGRSLTESARCILQLAGHANRMAACLGIDDTRLVPFRRARNRASRTRISDVCCAGVINDEPTPHTLLSSPGASVSMHNNYHYTILSLAPQVLRPDGGEVALPQTDGSVAAALVCIAFRAGAEVRDPCFPCPSFTNGLGILCIAFAPESRHAQAHRALTPCKFDALGTRWCSRPLPGPKPFRHVDNEARRAVLSQLRKGGTTHRTAWPGVH